MKILIALISLSIGFTLGRFIFGPKEPLIGGPEIKYLVKGTINDGDVEMYVTSLTYEGQIDFIHRPDLTVKE